LKNLALERRRAVLAPLGVLTLLTLAGCETDKIDYKPDYAAEPAITLAVGNVQVVDQRQPPAQSNFIDERRGNELTDETKRWLSIRIRAGGGGTARAIIDQASVTERLIANRTGGFFGWAGNEPTYTLDGNLAVRIVITDETGQERASASAHVGRSRSVGNRASIVERDNEARRLMADLIHDIEPNLKQAISQNLGQYATVANASGSNAPSGPTAGAGTAPAAGGQAYPPAAAGGSSIQSSTLPPL
jgi:hypothetical protein